MTFIGTPIGLAIAYAAGRSLQSLLAGVPPADWLTYICALAVIVIMTLAGTFWPALRAIRVDPMQAVRS